MIAIGGHRATCSHRDRRHTGAANDEVPAEAAAYLRRSRQSVLVSVEPATSWKSTLAFCNRFPDDALWQALAALARKVRGRWERRVDVHSSIDRYLLFTRRRAKYPFNPVVKVTWTDGVYAFQLENLVGVVTADKCFEPKSVSVMTAFLEQLVVDDT
jgi:hypothetical protein